MDPPRLTIFSTPLIATWALDETNRVLFDAGDGVTALLEGKIHKADVVALTHAHRDHIAGLPQLLNLRGGFAAHAGQPLRVVYPEDSGSLGALGQFLGQFDRMTAGKTAWQPLPSGGQVLLDNQRFLRTFTTHHYPDDPPGVHRSLGYQIGRVVPRLRPELRGLSQAALDRLRGNGGRDAITSPHEEIVFTVSGDTRPLPASILGDTRFLLHECTFLDSDEARCAEASARGHDHSCLSDVLDMVQNSAVQHLALYHISKRYTDEEIVRVVRAECARRDLRTRVSAALPGRVVTDVFAHCLWPQK